MMAASVVQAATWAVTLCGSKAYDHDGPAEDGGYYLLGMNSLHSKIFKNKNWGTETVRKDTLADLKDKKVHLLKELNDIDIFEDIKYHPSFQQFL